MAFIQVRGLSKSFSTPKGVRHILRDVSLDVDQGEFVSIVGAMGSGKSTLLSLLAGLTMPDGGEVTIGGELTRGVRRDAAFVFQNYSLLPWFTALENVRLAVEATFPEMTKEEQRRQATRTLEQVGLGNALDRRPRQLSQVIQTSGRKCISILRLPLPSHVPQRPDPTLYENLPGP